MKKVIVKINPELHEVQFDYTLPKNEVKLNEIRISIDIQSSHIVILDNTDELEQDLRINYSKIEPHNSFAKDIDEIFDTMKIKKV